jgi:hypothetical protein
MMRRSLIGPLEQRMMDRMSGSGQPGSSSTSDPRLPASVDDIDARWFSSVPLAAGRCVDISDVLLERLGAEDSLMGIVLRARLESSSDDAPSSVIVKLPLDRAERRHELTIASYVREIEFYRSLASRISARLPAAYWADVDPSSGDFVLVLEDLVDMVPGRDERYATDDEIVAIAREAARLHAAWWSDPELRDRAFLLSFDEGFVDVLSANLSADLPPFLELFDQDLDEIDLRIYGGLTKALPHAAAQLLAAPQTLVHSDLSLKNMLFGQLAHDPAIALIDWQLVGWGPGVRDLAMLVDKNVDPKARPAHEPLLLRAYHDHLVALGVDDYPFDQLAEDYRSSVLFSFALRVFEGRIYDVYIGRSTPEAVAMVRRGIAGRAGSALELDLLSLVEAD